MLPLIIHRVSNSSRRYPEDTYNGTGTSGYGNPWYLCTLSMAELFYRAISEYRAVGRIEVTNTSAPFFDYFAPSASVAAGQSYTTKSKTFKAVISSLEGWGDAFVRRVKFHTPADGHLTEEYDRTTGIPQGAADLTWSYASLLTASFARAGVTGQKQYVHNLAKLAS